MNNFIDKKKQNFSFNLNSELKINNIIYKIIFIDYDNERLNLTPKNSKIIKNNEKSNLWINFNEVNENINFYRNF